MKGIIMENNQKFVITYTKQNGESVTRKGKWTDTCKEWICAKGYACLSYLDLDLVPTLHLPTLTLHYIHHPLAQHIRY